MMWPAWPPNACSSSGSEVNPSSATEEYREAMRDRDARRLPTGAAELALCFGELRVKGRDAAWRACQAALAATDASIASSDEKQGPPAAPLREIVLALVRKAGEAAAARGAADGTAIAEGMALAKDLGNLPGNVCTPAYLAAQAKELAQASTG